MRPGAKAGRRRNTRGISSLSNAGGRDAAAAEREDLRIGVPLSAMTGPVPWRRTQVRPPTTRRGNVGSAAGP